LVCLSGAGCTNQPTGSHFPPHRSKTHDPRQAIRHGIRNRVLPLRLPLAGYRRERVEFGAVMDFHNDATSMARVLVQYIPSNLTVQREVEASLGVKLHISAIVRLRSTYHNIKEHRSVRGFDTSVVWMDERHENDMNKANRRFVAALTNARVA